MAQHGVEGTGTKGHDFGRTVRMASYGGLIFGPVATKWFGFLQKRVVFPGRPNTEIIARVAADQVLFASTNLFCFLSSMAIMEGTDPKKKLESTYFNALQKNWMVRLLEMMTLAELLLTHDDRSGRPCSSSTSSTCRSTTAYCW
jgi:protein Mpv17